MTTPTKQRIPGLVDTIQGAVNAFDDLATTIANPPADRPLRQAIGRSGQLYCNAVGSQPGTFLGPFLPGSLVAPLLCKPYWEKNGYSPPVPPDGFLGGQCNALYTVQVLVQDMVYRRVVCSTGVIEFEGNPSNNGLASIQGPLQRVYAKVTATGNCGPREFVLAIVDANGTERLGGTLATATATRRIDMLKFTPRVFRTDGDPDNCGNPSGAFEPGPTPPPTPSFPSGQQPGVDPDGQPFYFIPPIDPVVPGLDPIKPPTLPIVDNPPAAPPGPGEPGAPVTPPAGEPAEGEADEGEELVGVLVEVLGTPLNANRFQDVPVNVWRGIGYIRMGYPGRLGADISAGIAQSPQFYHAQQPGLTAWQVTPRNGFTIRVTPYYRTIE